MTERRVGTQSLPQHRATALPRAIAMTEPSADDLVARLLEAVGGSDYGDAIATLETVSQMLSPPKRRGGDRRAGSRRELHEALRAMASLLGLEKGKLASEVAREILDRCSRYRPALVETDPLRQAMQTVRKTGLPLPTSKRHVARI